jgi:5-methylcytosine-specific restriction protein A
MAKSLYDRRWRKRRAQQLHDHPLCGLHMEMRGETAAATVADHITPHRGDPVLFAGPLQSLCAECHSSWKQQQETSGRIKGCGLDGHPIDPSYPWKTSQSTPGGARESRVVNDRLPVSPLSAVASVFHGQKRSP